MKIYNKNYNPEDYIVVEYFLKSKTNLKEAAWSLAIGQSVGNPNVRSIWETDELFKKHSCIIWQVSANRNIITQMKVM